MYRCERRTLRPKGKGIAVSAGRRRRKATRQGPFLFLQTNVFSTALNGYDSLTATSDQMVCLLLGSLKKGTDTCKQICCISITGCVSASEGELDSGTRTLSCRDDSYAFLYVFSDGWHEAGAMRDG
jgi:hypothetical protein